MTYLYTFRQTSIFASATIKSYFSLDNGQFTTYTGAVALKLYFNCMTRFLVAPGLFALNEYQTIVFLLKVAQAHSEKLFFYIVLPLARERAKGELRSAFTTIG